MSVKGKRTLKNGVVAGYVKQKNGSWKSSLFNKAKVLKSLIKI